MTYLFIRGDEASPDKSRPMTPAIPAVLGGEVKITPVPLPITAACPDKQDFIIREALQSAEKAVSEAISAWEETRKRADQAEKALSAAKEADRKAEAKIAAAAGTPDLLKAVNAEAASAIEAVALAQNAARVAREDAEIARSALDLAEAKRSSLKAVLHVELIEDQGAKERGSEAWSSAAREAHAAQRQVAFLEARFNRQLASRDLSRARRQLDGLLAAVPAQKGDSLKAARAKAATDLVQARARAGRFGARSGEGRGGVKSAPNHGVHAPPARIPSCQDDLPRHSEQRPLFQGQYWPTSRTGTMDRRSPESTDSSRRGQSRMGEAFRRAFGRVLV